MSQSGWVESNAIDNVALVSQRLNTEIKQFGKENTLSQRDKNGDTLLTCAIQSQNVEMALMLLNKGVNPNTPDRLNVTPLMHAVNLKKVEIVEKLLEKEVDWRHICRNGLTAYMRAHVMAHTQNAKANGPEFVIATLLWGAQGNVVYTPRQVHYPHATRSQQIPMDQDVLQTHPHRCIYCDNYWRQIPNLLDHIEKAHASKEYLAKWEGPTGRKERLRQDIQAAHLQTLLHPEEARLDRHLIAMHPSFVQRQSEAASLMRPTETRYDTEEDDTGDDDYERLAA
jgi:hypothetical protein